MDFIKITNLKIFAHHGVFPEETKNGQFFYINAKLYLDCRAAGGTDDLMKSVHYGEACQFMTKFYEEHTYLLIETAAEKLAEALLLEYELLQKIELELCKPDAPIGLPFENVSVTIERGWHTVYLAMGSNMGEKDDYLAMGVEALKKQKEIRVMGVSDVITTKPYGVTDQDDFRNGAIAIQTLFTPQELLDVLHEIEEKAQRKRIRRWGPRTLDLDIIFYDKLVYEDENLIIPHVDMENRTFVLEPLMQLCPNYRHPILGKTVEQLLRVLKENKTE